MLFASVKNKIFTFITDAHLDLKNEMLAYIRNI